MAIYLHIGFPKTATTSLQLAFQEHAQDLQAQGVCYPLIDGDFKQRYLKLADQKGVATSTSMQKEFDRTFGAMADAIKASGCSDVILSCEELTNFMMMEFSVENLTAFRDRLHAINPDVRIITYVRNPSDFYLSILQERLKRNGGILPAAGFQTNFSRIIGLYEQVFDTKAIVREFHPSKLKNQDIVADFLDATGLTHIDFSSWEPVTSNETLSPEVLVVLDLARRQLQEDSDRLSYAFSDSELLWRRLRKICKEVGLTRKPILFKTVHDSIVGAHGDEIATMNETYGVDFAEGKYIVGEPAVAPSGRISDIEALMDVDRDQVTYLWSILMHDLIHEVFRLRKRVRQLKSEPKPDQP